MENIYWLFFWTKVHVVMNHDGELIAFKITKGNRHDAAAAQSLLESLRGLAFGDKGYIGKKLFEKLMESGLKLITRKRKNMKEEPLNNYEQQLLNQRGLIETVFNCLKNKYHVWHTRHRSVINALTHLMAALAAYVFTDFKGYLHVDGDNFFDLVGSNNASIVNCNSHARRKFEPIAQARG